MADRDSDTIPKFDGSGSVDFWLSMVEAAQVAHEWDDADMVKRSCLYLRGEAKSWFENGRLWEKNLTWDQFKTLITQRFSRKTPRHVVTADIGRLKPKPKEDIRDFAARMSALAHTSEPAIDAVDMCGMLLKALPPHYRTVRVETEADEDEFEALVNELRRIQVLDADTETEAPKREDKSRTGGGNNSRGGQTHPKFNGTCNYCGIKGHKEKDCRKKKRELEQRQTQQGPQAQGSRMELRKTNGQTRWDPKTHQPYKTGEIHCMFCGEDDHVRDDCHLWKRMLAMVAEVPEKPAASPSGSAKN